MKILDRYIIYESVQLLVIGSLCILGIFFGTVEFKHVLEILNEFGVPPNMVLAVMVLQMPTGMTYCMPAGVMIATMFTMVRQHSDSEILALQVSGVSLVRIMRPYLLMGFLGAIGVFLCSEYVAPQCRNMSEKLLMIGMYKADRPFADRTVVDFTDDKGTVQQLLLFGKTVGPTIDGFLVFDLTQKDVVKMIWAQHGRWQDGSWRLESGQLYELLNSESNGIRGKFATMRYGALEDMRKLIEAGPLCDLAKSTTQLKETIELFKKVKMPVPKEMELQYYRRFSHPVSCILLVLAALPLAISRKRRSTALPLVYGGLLVVTYFILQQITLSLAANERLDPQLGAWLPGCVLCFVGLALTFYLRRNY